MMKQLVDCLVMSYRLRVLFGEHFSLSDDSKEVAVHISGYVARTLKDDSETVVRNICLEIWFLKIQISLIFKPCREWY